MGRGFPIARYQDNKQSYIILLKENGKASSSKHTKHINIRYFFITDQISKNGLLLVVWCPTSGNMIEDYAMKPLQGAVYKRKCFRDYILGVVPVKDQVLPEKLKPVSGKVKKPG